HVYLVREGEPVEIYDRQQKTWATVAVRPLYDPARECIIHTTEQRAYLLVADEKQYEGAAFVSIDPSTRRVEVLASTRRDPARSPLDKLGLDYQDMSPNAAGE